MLVTSVFNMIMVIPNEVYHIYYHYIQPQQQQRRRLRQQQQQKCKIMPNDLFDLNQFDGWCVQRSKSFWKLLVWLSGDCCNHKGISIVSISIYCCIIYIMTDIDIFDYTEFVLFTYYTTWIYLYTSFRIVDALLLIA